MNVTQYNKQKKLPIDEKGVSCLVKAWLDFLEITTDEVAIHFLPVEEICRLHEEFFNDPSPTDCMTFPMDPPLPKRDLSEEKKSGSSSPKKTKVHFLGEMVISPAAAMEFRPEAPYEELSLYIAHSLLHLIGYKDGREEEQLVMREMERKLLSYAEKAGLILSPPSPKRASPQKRVALNSPLAS